MAPLLRVRTVGWFRPMPVRRVVRAGGLALALAASVSQTPLGRGGLAAATARAQGAASEAALPDVRVLIRDVRAHLEPDSELLRRYTYRERRQDVKVSKLGKVHLGPWREFEVYPSAIRGETYKRLVSVGGTPLAPAELARRDEEHRQRVLARLDQLEHESPRDRDRRLAQLEKDRREEQDVVDDVFAVYDIRVIGRETVDGRSTLVTSLVPRREAVRTRSDAGKFLKKMQGRAWINEADRQVVRVEMEAVQDLTFGMGLVGRMHKGSTVMFRRALVNGEIWLPAEARFKATGRAVVFRTFALESTTHYWDYRKFNVSTTETLTSDIR